MSLSSSCKYGLRAAVLLAQYKEGTFITIRELSDELNISFYFLTKVLQKLTKAEILESYKGPNGGVKFSKSIGSISAAEIIWAIDSKYSLNDCIFGLEGCGVFKPCPLQGEWVSLSGKTMLMLENLSVADLLQKSKINYLKPSEINHQIDK